MQKRSKLVAQGLSPGSNEPVLRGAFSGPEPAAAGSAATARHSESVKCLCCAGDNAPAASFCSSCGSPLHLKSCPGCDAVQDRTAVTCRACGAAFPVLPVSSPGAAAQIEDAPAGTPHDADPDPDAVPSGKAHHGQTTAVRRQPVGAASLVGKAKFATPTGEHSSADLLYRLIRRRRIIQVAIEGAVALTLLAGPIWYLHHQATERSELSRKSPGAAATRLTLAPTLAADVRPTGEGAAAGAASGLAAPPAVRPGWQPATARFKVAAGEAGSTGFRIARDLAAMVAPDAGLELALLSSAGSADNLYLLHDDPTVKLAVVQYDVIQAFRRRAAAGESKAERVVRPLQVIMPLYTEEIYFIARADSAFTFVHEIKGKKINVGPLKSGSAVTATNLYQLMFDAPMAEADVSFLSSEQALVKLVEDKSIDVVVVVAGQPTKLLADMKPEARQFIKLLRLDRARGESRRALGSYFPATVWSASYRNWLTEDVATLSVLSFLVTSDAVGAASAEQLSRFARSLCLNLANLRNDGHPKWRELQPGLALGPGFSYFPPTERELQSCPAEPRLDQGLAAANTSQDPVASAAAEGGTVSSVSNH